MAHQPKEIVFEEEARTYLKNGIVKLSKAVSFTLGPKGRNVGMEALYGTPKITNDGNEIARNIECSNPYENLGASLAKKTAEDIKNDVSDGTSSGIVLLGKIVEESLKYITSGVSPISLKRGLEKGVDALLIELEKEKKEVKIEDTYFIAKALAFQDEEIATVISEALKKAGPFGSPTVEESKGLETYVESVKGLEFDRGYLSPYFCTNPEKMIVEMENPFIVILNEKINSIHEILTLLQQVSTTERELLIIAEDLEGEVLSTLVINKLKGVLKIAAVKAPGYGDSRKELLDDIAAVTNATVLSKETHTSLKELGVQALGSAEKVIITKDKTLLINGSGAKESIQERVLKIEGQIERAKESYEKEKLMERKAKLIGGIAIIRVGATTETELKQKKQTIEDTLKSTQLALQEGMVIGGGLALIHAAEALKNLNSLQGEEIFGLKVLIEAVQMPFIHIVENAGYRGEVVLSNLKEEEKTVGFNVLTGKNEDFLHAFIVDPLKVIKSSLSHAVSTAKTVILSDALIIDAQE